MVRLLRSALLVGLLATSGAPARAQEDDAYRGLVRRAVQEHAAGRFAEARALFRQAHRRSPNARTLRGIGMTNFELREYAAAIVALEQSLAETRRPLNEAQQASVRDLIGRSEAFVARLTIVPAADRVLVDGVEALTTTDGTVLLEIGAHSIRVTCGACTDQTRGVRVTGGERMEMDFHAPEPEPRVEPEPEPGVEPQPEPVVEPGPEPVVQPEPGEAPNEPVEGEPPPVTAIALLAGAGVAAAGAVGAGLWWRDRNGELDRCDERAGLCLNRSRLDSERNAAAGVTAGMSVAAIALTVVGLLLLGSDDEADGSARLRCLPTIGGGACAGVF